MLRDRTLFFFSPDPDGGSPPVAPETPQAVDLQHTERIVKLEGAVTSLPTEFGRQVDDLRSDVFKRIDEVQSEVSTALGGVMDKLSALAPPTPEAPPAEPPAPPAPPEVNVETPKPQERKVRRGGRKVTRRG